MTIDEAITHAREVANEQRKDNDNCEYKAEYGCKGCADYYSKPCIECTEEHEQLAEWLEELKAYRAHIFSGEMTRTMLKEQYCKAVDDFVKLFKNKTSMENRLVDEIAEQLKTGIENIGSNAWMPLPELYKESEVIHNTDILDKKAAVEKSDDVCKWKFTSEREFIQNPHTKRLYSNEASMKNVYCNTCGKKIKAVE